jgi:hypothetical protein
MGKKLSADRREVATERKQKTGRCGERRKKK